MSVVDEIIRWRDSVGRESGKAMSGQVWLAFREILPGVFLIHDVGFRGGKKFFPDEPKANYLICRVARSKIVLWPKDLLFLDSADFFAGSALPVDQAVRLARKAGIDPFIHVWHAVSDTDSIEIYKAHCC